MKVMLVFFKWVICVIIALMILKAVSFFIVPLGWIICVLILTVLVKNALTMIGNHFNIDFLK